jgi:hypothetical protein
VNAGTTIWSYHPVTAATAAVWTQVGIGLWLLAAPRGDWSRLAGLASVGWGLNVWVFGEAFGGVFAPERPLLGTGLRPVRFREPLQPRPVPVPTTARP